MKPIEIWGRRSVPYGVGAVIKHDDKYWVVRRSEARRLTRDERDLAEDMGCPHYTHLVLVWGRSATPEEAKLYDDAPRDAQGRFDLPRVEV